MWTWLLELLRRQAEKQGVCGSVRNRERPGFAVGLCEDRVTAEVRVGSGCSGESTGPWRRTLEPHGRVGIWLLTEVAITSPT